MFDFIGDLFGGVGDFVGDLFGGVGDLFSPVWNVGSMVLSGGTDKDTSFISKLLTSPLFGHAIAGIGGALLTPSTAEEYEKQLAEKRKHARINYGLAPADGQTSVAPEHTVAGRYSQGLAPRLAKRGLAGA